MSHTPLLTVAHRSASGRLDNLWEFLPKAYRAARVFLIAGLGSAPPVELDVEVCTIARPLAGAFVLVRLGEDSWQLTPMRWPREPSRVARGEPFTESWPVGAVDLIRCPPGQREELEAL